MLEIIRTEIQLMKPDNLAEQLKEVLWKIDYYITTL